MIQTELQGHPKIIDEEMQLLKSAEQAARGARDAFKPAAKGVSYSRSVVLLTKEKPSAEKGLSGRLLEQLGSAKLAVEQALKGHPDVLQKEETALSKAAEALEHMG